MIIVIDICIRARGVGKQSILDPVLCLIAQDAISDVTLMDIAKKWIYHPYDGVMDVVLNSVTEKEELRSKHRDGIPKHFGGL